MNSNQFEDSEYREYQGDYLNRSFTTNSTRPVDHLEGIALLEEIERQATIYIFSIAHDFRTSKSDITADAFLSDRYATDVFIGIMIDTGTAN